MTVAWCSRCEVAWNSEELGYRCFLCGGFGGQAKHEEATARACDPSRLPPDDPR